MAEQKQKQKKDKEKDKEKEKAPGAQQFSTLREYFVTTVVMTIFALFVTRYVVHPMTVPTPSMVPTILVGDRLLIDKFTVRNSFLPGLPFVPEHKIRRGDIIVFKFPNEPEVLYVKRAIGLPGETIQIRAKTVHINGKPLDEPYKVHSDPSVYPDSSAHYFGGMGDNRRDNYGPIQIPADHFFMMGDNRDDSADSRYFGLLPKSHILGRPLVVFWSYEDAADAYRKTEPADLIKLYAERVIYFIPRTRWSRTLHMVR